MESDEDMYKALPQLLGDKAHRAINSKRSSTCKKDMMSLPVYSEELGLMGIIDIYKVEERLLIERKNKLKNLFKGQIYQLWAQYFCMIEMGYQVDKIAFYEITTKKMHYQSLPTNEDKDDLKSVITKYYTYSPLISHFTVNCNKCRHCIYCNLCDKTEEDNVYT